ncbi:MAG: aminodeoxychorismate/anthranilate synthase component II [Bacteroidales bacterium]|nr:aminodeoxychorismate/anthranilate synthase component II [Bacteroidales bacterium]
MKILVIDNYDSFTYNLVQYIKLCTNHPVDVFRNDKISLEDVGKYDKIIISPGPGLPKDSGIIIDVIRKYGSTKSILGVCLGMQAIGEVYGCKLSLLDETYHGVSSDVFQFPNHSEIFQNIPTQFKAGRYHSLGILKTDLHETIQALAFDSNEIVMAIKHRQYDVFGLQFHPESIMTEQGLQIISNFINSSFKEKFTIHLPAANSSVFNMDRISSNLFC